MSPINRSLSLLSLPTLGVQDTELSRKPAVRRRYSTSEVEPGPGSTRPALEASKNNARNRFLAKFNLSRPIPANTNEESMVKVRPEVQQLWTQRINAAKQLLLTNSPTEFVGNGRPLRQALTDLQGKLNSGELPAKMHAHFEKKLVGLVADNLICEDLGGGEEGKKFAKKKAKALFKESVVNDLNNTNWETITTRFQHNGKLYTDEMVPAGKMKFGEQDIFDKAYYDKGLCSSSTRTNHAVNLWQSKMTIEGSGPDDRKKFSIIRSAVLDAYGVKNKTQRKAAALNRAKEVVTAALFQKPEELQIAMETGEPISLNLTSSSLLTATNIGGTEGKQIEYQTGAWATLNKNEFVLQIRNAKGELKPVRVNLNAAAFNFGVNEAALTMGAGSFKLGGKKIDVAKLNLGWKQSDDYNKKGLEQLLGNDLTPDGKQGGMVGQYLKEHPNAKNAELVHALSSQICKIWENKSHHQDGGEPYKMPTRIAFLSHEIGAAPCTNCKSGKDRTGMMDTEFKYMVAYWNEHKKLPEIGSMPKDGDQQLLATIALESGNQKIQEQNTGIKGNKVIKYLSGAMATSNLSLRARLGETTAKIIQGGSKHVHS